MEHVDIPLGEIHSPHNWEFADPTVMAAASISDAGLIGKVALVLSTMTAYRLSAVAPAVWTQISNTAGVDMATQAELDAVASAAALDATGKADAAQAAAIAAAATDATGKANTAQAAAIAAAALDATTKADQAEADAIAAAALDATTKANAAVATAAADATSKANAAAAASTPIAHAGATGTAHGNATTSVAGFMAAADKSKLDGIAAGAQVNVATNIAQGTRTTTSVPVTSSTGTGATLDAATTSLAGVMTAADKSKLDGIATGANNYSLPAATSTVRGGVELFSDTVQTVAANAVTTTASRTYGAQVNSGAQVVVNVPWTDTVYTHPASHPPSIIAQDANNRFVTDTEKATWNAKQTALGYTAENTANKGVADGYAGLDATGKVPSVQLPSTDAVPEGSSNLYHTVARVRDTLLAGFSTASSAVVTATDSVLTAFGKLQAQITGHTGNTGNPHSVTKAQVGLSNVDNTSDVNKPVSTATQTALNAKANLDGNVTHTGGKKRFEHNPSSAAWDQAQIEAYSPAGATTDFSRIAFHVQDAYNAPQFGYHYGLGRFGLFDSSGNALFTTNAGGGDLQTAGGATFGSRANAPEFRASGTSPYFSFADTNAAADLKNGRWVYADGVLYFEAINDAYSAVIRTPFSLAADNSLTLIGPLRAIGHTVMAANYLLNNSTSETAGTYGFGNANGPAIVLWGNTAAGAGMAELATNGATRLQIKTDGEARFVNGVGFGYGSGSGGTVTQAVSKGEVVTINKPSGLITMHNAALAAGASIGFQVNNSTVAISDQVVTTFVGTLASVHEKYSVRVAVGIGVFYVYLTNESSSTLSEAVPINFVVIKGSHT